MDGSDPATGAANVFAQESIIDEIHPDDKDLVILRFELAPLFTVKVVTQGFLTTTSEQSCPSPQNNFQ